MVGFNVFLLIEVHNSIHIESVSLSVNYLKPNSKEISAVNERSVQPADKADSP